MTLPSFWESHCQSADWGGSSTAQNVASAARGGIGYDRGTGEAGRRDPDEEAIMASIRVVDPAAGSGRLRPPLHAEPGERSRDASGPASW
jgi:hypothetical protein